MTQVTDRLSSSVAEVAAHSANFEFLLPHQPLLVLCGAEAEVSIFAAPIRSLERAVNSARSWRLTYCTARA